MPRFQPLATLGRLLGRTPPPTEALEAYAHAVIPVVDRAEWLYEYWLEQSALFTDGEKLGNVAAIHRWEAASMGRALEGVTPPAVLAGAHAGIVDALELASRAAQLLSSGSRFHNANAVCEGQAMLIASRERRLAALRSMRRYLAAVVVPAAPAGGAAQPETLAAAALAVGSVAGAGDGEGEAEQGDGAATGAPAGVPVFIDGGRAPARAQRESSTTGGPPPDADDDADAADDPAASAAHDLPAFLTGDWAAGTGRGPAGSSIDTDDHEPSGHGADDADSEPPSFLAAARDQAAEPDEAAPESSGGSAPASEAARPAGERAPRPTPTPAPNDGPSEVPGWGSLFGDRGRPPGR